MEVSLLTTASWPIVGQLAGLLGKVMEFIYTMLDNILSTDSGLVGLSIIIYTIIVYTIMLPLTIKQQKTSKMSSFMNPEIQAIQKKYKNKKDQVSMMKQQEETQQVYDKYGTSMASGCLPMLIQMPLLFALYPVIYDIKAYVPAIKTASSAVNRFLTIPDLTMSPAQMFKDSGSFGLPSIVIIITALAIPVLSGFTQFMSIKLSQITSGQQLGKDNPMAGTMKTMNYTMPIFSVVMVFSFPTGIGLYWIVSAVVRCVQQALINKYLSKIEVKDLIEKNKEKAAEKVRKRGEKADKINYMAQTNTRSIKDVASQSTTSMSEKEKEEVIAKAQQNVKPGSLSDKASMVRKFNENN